MKKLTLFFCCFILTGCSVMPDSRVVRAGVHAGRMLMDDLDEAEHFESDEGMRAQVRSLKEQLRQIRFEKNRLLLEHLNQDEVKRVKDLTMKEKNVHHSGHINIHNYILKKNHLDDNERAELQAKIAWHEKELRDLRCIGY